MSIKSFTTRGGLEGAYPKGLRSDLDPMASLCACYRVQGLAIEFASLAILNSILDSMKISRLRFGGRGCEESLRWEKSKGIQ